MPPDSSEDFSKKQEEEKNRAAAAQLAHLIYLVNKYAAIEYEQLKSKFKADPNDTAASPPQALQKDINHALTLLAAAREEIKKTGPSALTDYLVTSAMSHVAKHLPETAVNNIVEELKKNETAPSVQPKQSEVERAKPTREPTKHEHSKFRQPVAERTKPASAGEKCDRLLSCLSTKLLTPEQAPLPPKINKQVIIDFAADKIEYGEYGKRRAKKLGGDLIQATPDQFSATSAAFSIEKNTTLTLIGHCTSGSNCLSDNSGRIITAAEIAKQIHLKMLQKGTSLDTEFNIDLIACQAAASRGRHPPFAQQLVNELARLGINNVNIIASPTIMLTTHDGSQANISREQERAYLDAKSKGQSYSFGSSGRFSFQRRQDPSIKVEKQVFRARSSSIPDVSEEPDRSQTSSRRRGP